MGDGRTFFYPKSKRTPSVRRPLNVDSVHGVEEKEEVEIGTVASLAPLLWASPWSGSGLGQEQVARHDVAGLEQTLRHCG